MKAKFKILIILLLPFCQAQASNKYFALMKSGDSCMDCHNIFAAMNYYLQAETLHPSFASPKLKLADCYYLRADYRRCIDKIRKAALSNVDSLYHDSFREMFYSYGYLADYHAQLHWGSSLLQRYPFDSEIVAGVAGIYNRDGIDQPQMALELTDKYLAVDSTDIRVLTKNADARFFLMKFDDASKVYRRLLQLGDSSFNTMYSLGMCYYQTKDYQNARSYLMSAAKINEYKSVGCLYRLGMACLEADSVKEAIDFLTKSKQLLSPDKAVSYIVNRWLGDALYTDGHIKEAVASWETALDGYDTDSAVAYYNLAHGYMVLGDARNRDKNFRLFKEKAKGMDDSIKLTQMIKEADMYLKTGK
jgi:tetratricopeptide (TPR) repeat protein